MYDYDSLSTNTLLTIGQLIINHRMRKSHSTMDLLSLKSRLEWWLGRLTRKFRKYPVSKLLVPAFKKRMLLFVEAPFPDNGVSEWVQEVLKVLDNIDDVDTALPMPDLSEEISEVMKVFFIVYLANLSKNTRTRS